MNVRLNVLKIPKDRSIWSFPGKWGFPYFLKNKTPYTTSRTNKILVVLAGLSPWLLIWERDRFNKGPLKIWTEHSNFPLQGRGYTKTPYTFTLMWNYFPKHIKAEGMIKFNIFHILAENSVNSVICFFWALLQASKTWNSSNNAHFRSA